MADHLRESARPVEKKSCHVILALRDIPVLVLVLWALSALWALDSVLSVKITETWPPNSALGEKDRDFQNTRQNTAR